MTADQKLKAIRRELAFRRRCYPRWVANGKMTKAEADHEIAAFEAIEADYAALSDQGKLL